MTEEISILFRCDGSVEIGMGHVVRCLALADHLKENNDCNIHFAMRQSELGINKVEESYQVIQSDEKDFNYSAWLTDCIEKTKAEIMIMDMRDGLSRGELKQIKKKTGIKVVTIDDPEDKRLESDMAFYPPVPQLEKTNWDGLNGKLCAGWEYVILRKEFSRSYPRLKNPIPNILVSMGGTDEKNMTRFVIEALSLIEARLRVSIILGQGYQYKNELLDVLAEAEYDYFIYNDTPNIAEIMSQSDLGIISFGVSAYELAALNIPAIYLCLTPDHEESSNLFVNEGIGVSMGQYTELRKQDLKEAIIVLLKEKQKLADMVHRAKSLDISNMSTISNLILG